MSTDLQLRHELPNLRISAIKTIPSDLATVATHVKLEQGDGHDDDDESYRTPTSKESKIPVIITCPRAPLKAKQVSCKRKLMDEYQFFEVGNKEEMDVFLLPNFPKRSCRCT